jgi:hypothetical protein
MSRRGRYTFQNHKFFTNIGTLNNTLKLNLVQRSIRLKLNKILALPTLLFISEIWTLIQFVKNRL